MYDSDVINRKINCFKQLCAEKGIKLTHQRIEIYKELISTDEHPNADTVYQEVQKRIPTISLDTVYRNLKFLSEKGLIATVGISTDRARFDADIHPHSHFICIQCGRITDCPGDSFKNMVIPQEISQVGIPTTWQVEIKGVCNQCLESEKCTQRSE